MVNPNYGCSAGYSDEETMNIVLDCYARLILQNPQPNTLRDIDGFSAQALTAAIALLAAERVIAPSSFNQLYHEAEKLIGEATVHGVFIVKKSRQFEAEE